MDNWQDVPRLLFGSPRRAMITLCVLFVIVLGIFPKLALLLFYTIVVPPLTILILVYILIGLVKSFGSQSKSNGKK